ncbi:MAG: signal peptide peptidase SppA [Flavobacteriaceae bacterium]|nr:signal peptide peptidase SppA [Flavobacteriaceae bacterium]
MKFLGNLFTVILGCLIATGILFVMFFFFVALVGSSDQEVAVSQNSILRFEINKPLVEYDGKSEEDPFEALFEESIGLNKILKAIEHAKTDSRIRGISIENNFITGGMAQTKVLRDALEDFKSSGKFVYAYGDIYTQKNYYLASVADSMFINPVGSVDFRGLASEVLFFKDLQEKIGVNMEVIRHGKYKSAVEPFLSNEMSESNREQITALLQDLWMTIKKEIGLSRSLGIDRLDAIADSLGARSPELALTNGMIDKISYLDQYEASLKLAAETTKPKSISLQKYVKAVAKTGNKYGKDKIAVIYAQGDIIYGKGDDKMIGQTTMLRAIEKAIENKDVKGIVLRIDSPGGSALTSEIIWRALENAKTKKPLVVSMGNVAASGGYYIAAGAEKIFAEPNTVTGSIGVFGIVPNAAVLAKRIGIHAEQVGTNKNAFGYSLFEPMSDSFEATVTEGIEKVYDTFLSRVAAGRNMSIEAVDKVAQGRVWSGLQAQQNGLVDEIGGLDDAIAYMAEKLEITKPGIKEYPKFKSNFETFMEDFGAAAFTKHTEGKIKSQLGEDFYEVYQSWKKLQKQQGVQARLPFALNIK